MNAKMPELKRAFEAAGFTNVKTVISSGNVVFDAKLKSTTEIERKAEAAMEKHLDRSFVTFVRSVDALNAMLESNPHAKFDLPADAKRIVAFLRAPKKPAPRLPIEMDDAWILAMKGAEAFMAYVPSPRGPVFMTLIEKTFSKDLTTRTWDTVMKCVKA